MNVCEHGDHEAPEGKRFCSIACEQCEHTQHDYERFNCANVCGRADAVGTTDEELRIVTEVYARLPEAIRATTILGGLTALRDNARKDLASLKRTVQGAADAALQSIEEKPAVSFVPQRLDRNELDALMTRLRGRLDGTIDPDLAAILAEMNALRMANVEVKVWCQKCNELKPSNHFHPG